MSDVTPFYVDRAKGGRASCKGCKGNCPGGELRIAKLVASPYGDNQTMKSWHHVDCFMNALLKQRPVTKRVDSIDDIGNWENISKEDQEFILKKLNETEKLYAEKNSEKNTAKVLKNESAPKPSSAPEKPSEPKVEVASDDDKFTTFIKLCKKIAKVDAYTEKTAKVNNFFRKGTGESFEGDLALWCKLLLPQVTKRVYNLKSKQLVKLFSKIFNTDHDDMLTHLEQGDVAETIQYFFSKSKAIHPAQESTLTIHNIEEFLQELSKLTKEEEQIYHFKKIVKKCTLEDLKMVIRLIKGDLRINAGPKHILEGVHPDAYTAFQTSRDLNMVLDRILSQSSIKHKDATQNSVHAKLSLMTPVLPMLAEACKSVEMAMKKCPNGMFSEIKYDGERVQVHKKGNEFKYFSRALKPVMPHKVNHFKDYLPKAFPKGTDLILDAEVLMVDVNTGKPLPFGTLGIHKQSAFKDAQVCLYVFDCLYYNGQVLIDMPIRKRRQFLYDNMVEVTNHVMYSEQQLIEKPADLAKMIAKVLQLGLEGLVLKDLESKYEPGKRHWLKVKKDYLFDGAMADTADLVVLGAWFGTGKKGGMMSVFLMGCLDKRRNKWVTVTKVHTGHDDSTLERLQKELSPLMVKISQDYNKVPSWLDCNKGMVPDFIAADPKKQPVWEITGTELTKANLHTADGISVRFPRVTRIRNDKDWETATNLDELKHLYKTSKEKTDVSLLNKFAATASEADVSPQKKNKGCPSKVSKIDSYFSKKDVSNGNSSSMNTSSSSDTSKNEGSYNDDEMEEKIVKDRKIKIKEEDLFTIGNLDINNEEVDTPNKKMKKIKDKDLLDGSKCENSDIKETPSKRDKRKIKQDSYDDIKDGIENSSHKKYKKKKIKEELNITNSVENETDDEPRKISNSSKNLRSSDDVEEMLSKKDKRKIKEEFNRTSSSENKTDDGNDIGGTSKKDKKRKHKENRSNSSENVECDDEAKSDESQRKKRKSKKRRNSRDSTDMNDFEASINEDLDIDYESGPKDPLPDVFIDKRLGFYPDFISFPEDERMEFERHWIAYGGTVVKSIRSMDVDYVLHNNKSIDFKQMQKLRKKVPEHTTHVYKDWLDKCIDEIRLCDTRTFSVIVEPSNS